VLILGVILLIIGFVIGSGLLELVGGILAVVGLVLLFAGGIGGRRIY
jgi:hypothetical protein